MSETRLQKLFSFILTNVLLTAILSGAALPVAAQKRQAIKKTIVKQMPPPGNQNCKGGWSGIVTFKKTLSVTTDTGMQKNRIKGSTHHKASREYKYTGRIIVDGSAGETAPLTTKSQILFNDTDKTWKRYEEMDTCAYDGTDKSVLHWSETEDDRIINAFGEGAANFNLNVNELGGTYGFSFSFPAAKGIEDNTGSIGKGGWCNPKNNLPGDDSSKTPTSVDGEGAQMNDLKIDPKNPGVLTGSKTWGAKNSFVYTVS